MPTLLRRLRALSVLLFSFILPAALAQTAPSAAQCTARIAPSAEDPQTRVLTQPQRVNLLNSFFADVNRDYLDPKFGGFDWKTQAEITRQAALAAPTDALFYADIRNLVDRVNDGHFSFLSPQEARSEDLQARGEQAPYGGAGMTLAVTPTGLTVSQVFPGSPAERAGIHSGDTIVGVNGQDCPSADQIRGPVGSSVTLSLRAPDGAPRSVTLTRALVSVPPLSITATRLAGRPQVGYLRFDSFFLDGVAGQLQAKLKALLAQSPMTELIIDLRSNGGGFVDEGEQFLGNFTQGLQGNRVDRAGEKDPIVIQAGPLLPQLKNVKLAVLVGPGTASMAEISAAILKQSRGALVLGAGTAKLTSNFVNVELPYGARIHMTDVDVYLLSGKRLGATGVVPDISFKVTPPAAPDADPLVARAVQALGAQQAQAH